MISPILAREQSLPLFPRLIHPLHQLIAKIQKVLTGLWQSLKAVFTTLPKPAPEQGIATDGNSCFLAVVLQDLADSANQQLLLQKQLQKKQGENRFHFQWRQELQGLLRSLTTKIQRQEGISLQEIGQLRKLLAKNGWGAEKRTFKEWLQQLPPKGDAFGCYNAICGLLEQKDYLYNAQDPYFQTVKDEIPSLATVHIFPKEQLPFTTLLSGVPIAQKGPTLWKIRCDPKMDREVPLEIKTESFRYNLRQVHLHEETPSPHVSVIRQIQGVWTHCNDDRLEPVLTLPQRNICRVVYERRAIAN